MELTRTSLGQTPGDPGAARLSGTVQYADGVTETYWLDVPADRAGSLTRLGDPWLAWLLPLAAQRGEPLRLATPVDATLLAHTPGILRVWRSWYPDVHSVTVEADAARPGAAPPDRVAAFLSGGVDSWYTAVRPRDHTPPDEQAPVDDLITVGGFDIPRDRAEAWARLVTRLGVAARRVGRTLVPVVTNLRETRWREVDWGRLGHGAALAGVALALSPRYRAVYVAATGGYRDLHPWGSHPLTDPLWSTAATRVVHDGAAATRVEKTRALLAEPAALETLRVCWRSETDQNCGACNKCYRTMILLELLGALDRCPTFPSRQVDPARAARIYCAESWDVRELRDLARLAADAGRPDLGDAVERAMRRSGPLRRRIGRLRALRDAPLVWRWAGALERRLLAGWLQ